jgi:hypothetical protein
MAAVPAAAKRNIFLVRVWSDRPDRLRILSNPLDILKYYAGKPVHSRPAIQGKSVVLPGIMFLNTL